MLENMRLELLKEKENMRLELLKKEEELSRLRSQPGATKDILRLPGLKRSDPGSQD